MHESQREQSAHKDALVTQEQILSSHPISLTLILINSHENLNRLTLEEKAMESHIEGRKNCRSNNTGSWTLINSDKTLSSRKLHDGTRKQPAHKDWQVKRE